METKEVNNIQRQDYTLEWIYGEKEIKISILPVENNENVVINIHGTFWSLTGSNDKYLNFAQAIQQKQIANSVLFASSRKNVEPDMTITDRYKQKQAKFIGKTFQDELEDARKVVLWVIENAQKIFGIQKENLKITLNGNSLGGILAFYIASELSEVINISTVGTWLRLEIKDVPILNTFPNPNEITQKLQSFHGKFLMQYGSEDDVFTPEAFADLYQKVATSQKSFVHLLGVDHTFGKVSGNTSPKAYEAVLSHIEMLVAQWELVSWEFNLFPQENAPIQETKGLIEETLWKTHFSPNNN